MDWSGGTSQAGGIDARAAQVVLEHQPRRRHLRGDDNPLAQQVLEAEPRVRLPTDEHEGIASNNLGEADQRARGVGLMVRHHPHRAAPGDISRALQQHHPGSAGGWRGDQVNLDPSLREVVSGEREIKRSVAEGTHVLAQTHADHRLTIPPAYD